MRIRDLLLSLDETPGLLLWKRVARTLRKAVLEGRLPPGAALPGTRLLADHLQVNRQTVILALQELEAEGWILTEPNRGTFVAVELPSGFHASAQEATEAAPSLGFDLPSFLLPVSTSGSGSSLLLADGAADPRLAPAEELARAYQRALQRHGPSLLQDRDPLGIPFLREGVAAWVSERHGTRIDPSRVIITRGSGGALALLAGAIFRTGDLAAVENPGNRGAWDILRQGSRIGLRPVPIDEEGMDPEALEALLGRERIRMLYLTPRRQFPTAGSMSRDRGLALLKMAAKHRLAVVEDDYDGEFCYGEPRPEPLLAYDPTAQVIHIGSLSRLLAPGLRLGYLVVPTPLAPFLARVKRTLEDQGDPAFEWSVADLIRDGELARHLRRTRKIYQARRDFLVALLRERLGEHLELAVPGGGMGLWVQVRGSLDANAWVQSARTCGLMLNAPSHFFLENPQPAFRMGFAQADESELTEAVSMLEKGLAALH